MADAIAEKSTKNEAPQEKTPEEIEKDEAALELLKELDAEEEADKEKKDASDSDDTDESEGAKSKEADGGQADDDKTPDDDSDSDDTDSQSEKGQKGKRGYKRRHSRLIEQREAEKREKEKLAGIAKTLEEENKLLKLKLKTDAGQPAELKEPDPDQYDGGELDPEYLKLKRDFDQAQFRKIAREEASNLAQQSNQQKFKEEAERELARKKEEHWSRADELGAEDYDDKEGKAIETMGAEMVTNIIDYFPEDSHKIVYYLGTNSKEAEEIAALLENQKTLVQGVALIGQIRERMKVADPTISITPDPDKDNVGSAASPQESLQARLDSIRDDVSKTGRKDGMRRIMEFKRKARKRGIILT